MNPLSFPHVTSEKQDALAEAPPDLIARIALMAPDAGQPDNAILAAAKLRIYNRPHRIRTIAAWSGWAAAACLAALLAADHFEIFGHQFFAKSSAGNGSRRSTGSAGANSNEVTPQGLGENASEDISSSRSTHALNPGMGSKRRSENLSVIQNMDQLQRDLKKLRAVNDARFHASPGLSRTVVVEMTDPADVREAARLGTLSLSERVAESIAAGVPDTGKKKPETEKKPAEPEKPTKESTAEKPLVLSGGDGSWNGDLVIEKGLPNTGMLNLPEGTQIKHLDFPVEDAANYRGLEDLGAGYFHDKFSDVLWKPTGQGKVYIGEKAPAGFDAESFSPPASAATQIAQKPASESPPMQIPTTVSDQPPVDASAPQLAASEPIRGYPIFDETTGSGSIILQNLGAAGPASSYQLWVTDPVTAQPISVGLLPNLEAGEGRVWFDLGGPGVAPSGYLLTLEPLAGSAIPTGRVVLKGP